MSQVLPQHPLASLSLIEFRPGALLPGVLDSQLKPEFEFCIPTCQRTIVLSLRSLAHSPLLNFSREYLVGQQAYRFFLQFACGLQSQVKGETDVFGQVKVAFRELQEKNPLLSQKFRPLFTSWLEDTKEIRSQFLQGIGGNNYGALSRRLLNPQAGDRVVMLGAGLVSKTVAPYFSEFELNIWNRGRERLQILEDQLFTRGHPIQALYNEEALHTAMSEATLVILATPADADFGQAFLKHLPDNARVLHLGGQRDQLHALAHLGTRLLSLTDLFEIDQEQSQVREKQVRQALDACNQRSLLRSLARSIHIAHGWEDLALFY